MMLAIEVVEPISLGLKIAFVAVLYIFLLWVVRSLLKDLGRSSQQVLGRPHGNLESAPILDATGMWPAASGRAEDRPFDPRLVVERAPGLTAGVEYELSAGAMLGRSEQVEIRLEDRYASSQHARLTCDGMTVVLEDLDSTNGTYLNEEIVRGASPLRAGDHVRIGDSEFIYLDR